ncbi:hypothetical protein NQ317_008608 [Molorchus minor]|uniref:SWIM-type domain-containing protein n=1 Tax=Molorchus minor TaxID=1323400 RepID=A0ABQ9JB38_9CUCU|nr:hypothetical protein NQ317_008608 [Molorchus minor]
MIKPQIARIYDVQPKSDMKETGKAKTKNEITRFQECFLRITLYTQSESTHGPILVEAPSRICFIIDYLRFCRHKGAELHEPFLNKSITRFLSEISVTRFTNIIKVFENKMAGKHVIKLSTINEFLANDNKIIKKGENALESNHVKTMRYDADLMIICLNNLGEHCFCNMYLSQGIKCHHIATLALFGHYNISITDKECTWNVPKTKTVPVKTAEELYPPKPYVAIEQLVTKTKVITTFGNTVGFTWLLQEESVESESNHGLPIIEHNLRLKNLWSGR